MKQKVTINRIYLLFWRLLYETYSAIKPPAIISRAVQRGILGISPLILCVQTSRVKTFITSNPRDAIGKYLFCTLWQWEYIDANRSSNLFSLQEFQKTLNFPKVQNKVRFPIQTIWTICVSGIAKILIHQNKSRKVLHLYRNHQDQRFWNMVLLSRLY